MRVQAVEESAHVFICPCRLSNPEGDKLNQPTTSKSTQETHAGLHSLDEIALYEDFCEAADQVKNCQCSSVFPLQKSKQENPKKRKVSLRTTEKIYGSKQVLGAVTPKTG